MILVFLILRSLLALSPLLIFFIEETKKVKTHDLLDESYTSAIILIPVALFLLYYLIGKSYQGDMERFKELIMAICSSYLMFELLLEVEEIMRVYECHTEGLTTVIRLCFLLLNLDINMYEIRHLWKAR